jgi:hypothetical protein
MGVDRELLENGYAVHAQRTTTTSYLCKADYFDIPSGSATSSVDVPLGGAANPPVEPILPA